MRRVNVVEVLWRNKTCEPWHEHDDMGEPNEIVPPDRIGVRFVVTKLRYPAFIGMWYDSETVLVGGAEVLDRLSPAGSWGAPIEWDGDWHDA